MKEPTPLARGHGEQGAWMCSDASCRRGRWRERMGGWESSLSGRKRGEEWDGWILEKRKGILVRAVLDRILGSHSYSLRLKVEFL